ncbi:MAG TPA: hypothetical protein VLV56_09665 [Burkholderiales bacterium]|nr:hypothetical protein [Burkholderiales bacterium]
MKPQQNPHKSVADIESFITMLRVACEDRSVSERLERLLCLPDAKRQAVVHSWVSDLLIAGAPRDFIAAVACLSDDRIAEKAYETIYRCKREPRQGHTEGNA